MASASPLAIAAALCVAHSARVDAADYVVSTEAELRAAIVTANGDGDPSSTITLGNDLTISDPDPMPAPTKPLSIVAGNNQLSLMPAIADTLALGAPVNGTGTILHIGAGTTIMAGESSYTGTLRIQAGTLVIQAGAQVPGVSQLYLGDTAGQSGTLTVIGSGSYLSLTGTAGQTVVGRVGTGVLNIDAGAMVDAASLQVADGDGNGTVNVTGAGSTLSLTGDALMFIGASGQGTLNILNGGRVVTAGGSAVGNSVLGLGTALVSGSDSTWENTGVFSLRNGSLSVLDGAYVAADSILQTTAANRSFDVLVAGTGTRLESAGTFQLATTAAATGVVTIVDGGVVRIGGGVLEMGVGTAVLNIGGAEGAAPAAAGTLDATAVTMAAATGRVNFNHTNAAHVFTAVISGMGRVNQTGPGTTVLTDDSTYAGGTTITQGTLQLGNSGNSGSIVGDVENEGTLAFNRGDVLTFTGAISGTGGLRQSGTGTTVLTGANTYTGGTTIAAGTLQLGNGGATGSIQGNVLNNGTLAFNQSNTIYPFAGVVSGTGGLRQGGTGTVILIADNTYTGGTAITAGTLQLGAGGTTGSIQGDVLNNGTLAFNRSGAVTFVGTISGTGAVRQDGTGTTVLTGDSAYTGGTTITQGTLQLGDGGTSGSIVGDVLNNGTLAFNRADTLPFAGAISGTGGVRQDGSGAAVLTGANTYSGGTQVNAGMLRAGVAGVFSPASAVTVAAAGTLDLASFDQTIAGLTNAGLVSLRGAPGTRLTVAGNYTGQGGILALNTFLGGDSSASDRLAIQGGTATGETRIHITNTGGPGAQTVEGIRVVETQAGGTTAADAFRLDTRVVAGAYEYQLFRGGSSSADDWYLRSYLIDPPPPPAPDEPAPPGGPAIPLYRPEVALYAPIAAIGRQMGLATLGTLHERVSDQENIRDLTGGSAYANGGWARIFGERARNHWDGTVAARATGDLIGLQAGFDILRTQPYAGGHRDHVGVYVAYTDYNAPKVSGFALGQQNLHVGRLSMSGPAVGAYWTHFGPGGWYVDAVFQSNWFEVKANSGFGSALNTNGMGYAASLEAGYPIHFGTGWQIEPQGQVIWQGVSIDNSRDMFSSVAWDAGNAATGRLGARLQYTGRDEHTLWQPYAKANLWHTFSGTDRVGFGRDTPVENRFGDTALEVGAGMTARVNQNASLYAKADYRWSLDGSRSRQTAAQGAIGIRFNW